MHRREGSEVVIFHCTDGSSYQMYHDQGCCESVTLEDIAGDLEHLLHTPLLMAEEVASDNRGPLFSHHESYTWTFNKFEPQRGYVTLRWYGYSNGYYSESVQFKQIES